MFTPIRTERLLIRGFRDGDADELWQRRNDPEVARYQNWAVPFPRGDAARMAAELAAMSGPADGEWWMAVVEDAASGETLGDLALHLSWGGRTAEVGYTFASAHWGRGYAVEALEALIAWLYGDPHVTRVFGMLHPDNPASAMVLERCGMLFEGHTRSSFWLGDDCSDDWIYGMTRGDWEVWTGRPRHAPGEVRLIDITRDNYEDVARLRAHRSQERFVSSVAESFGDALFPEAVDGAPVVPWLRAVEADGVLAGFVMLALATGHHPEPYLWRLLVDRLQQRRGIGRMALDLVAAQCRAMGDTTLLTSWEEGKGSPRPFYLDYGFVPTGNVVEGETEARLPL